MFEIQVEGVYESDVGSGQEKYVDFNYDFKTSRLTENGLYTHIAKRFIPMLIAQDKSKKSIFSRLRSFNIVNVTKIENDENCIIGKNIDELDAWGYQDLACTFDLYDVPLYGKVPLSTLKHKAINAYFKKVWEINMDDPKARAKLDCVVTNYDGSYKFDFSNDKVAVQIPEGYLQQQKKEQTKVKVSDLMKSAAQAASTEDLSDGNETSEEQDGFPSAGSLSNLNFEKLV